MTTDTSRFFVALTVGCIIAHATCTPSSSQEIPPEPIDKVDRRLEEFEKTKQVELLMAAKRVMERVSHPAAERGGNPVQARQQQTKWWLKFFSIIEKNLDPKFDPNDVPSRGSMIGLPNMDPFQRAEYEAARERNEEKSKYFRLQLYLRRLDDSCNFTIKYYSSFCYTPSAADQKELSELISQSGLSEERKKKLRGLFAEGLLVSHSKVPEIVNNPSGLNDRILSRLAECEKTKSAKDLGAVRLTMHRLYHAEEKEGLAVRARQQQTRMWLKVFEVIDRNLDPNFDFCKDWIRRPFVPPQSKAAQLPAEAEAKTLKAPADGTQGDAAQKSQEEKINYYSVQVGLRYSDDDICLHYFRACYTSSAEDQKELNDLLQASRLSEARKQKLKALFK